MKTLKIYGPPGTGKTTRLLGLLQETVEQGYSPLDIAFLSHTNAAKDEAIARVMKAGGLKKDCEWFRTSHSAANRLTGLDRSAIWGSPEDWLALRREEGWTTRHSLLPEDNIDSAACALADGYEQAWTDIKSKVCPLEEGVTWLNQHGRNIKVSELRAFGLDYERCKDRRAKFDFPDMLKRFLEDDYEVPFKVLFLDEAQDFSRMQWMVVQKIAKSLDLMFIAGDDDQAIFTFNGADDDGFHRYPADEEIVLEKSWRCPEAIGRYADSIVARISDRKQKAVQWQPKTGGMYWPGGTIDGQNWNKYARGDETVMIVCRHRHRVNSRRVWLTKIGIPSTRDTRPDAWQGKDFDRIYTYLCLRYRQPCDGGRVARLLGFMGRGPESKRIYKQKGNISRDDLSGIDWETEIFGYLSSFVKPSKSDKKRDIVSRWANYRQFKITCGSGIFKTGPLVDVTTVHSAKGREADIVIIDNQCAVKVQQEQNRHPDEELRIAYVAVTRAKKEVHVISSPNPKAHMIGLSAYTP